MDVLAYLEKGFTVEINLHLKKHCIETGARLEFERLLGEYFKKSSPESRIALIEEQLEMLKIFLEKVDFRKLRSNYPELNGDHNTKATLKSHPHEGKITILCQGKAICSIKL